MPPRQAKLKRLEHDLEILDENHTKLADKLREAVCDEEDTWEGSS